MTATLAPVPAQYYPNTNNTGAPAAGFKLFTYIAGTSTKQNTWTDSTQAVINANPLPLDANGFAAASASASVWLDPTLVYKFVWAPANDTDPPSSPIRTIDNIRGPLDLATLTAAVIGSVLYPRTAAEIAAGVTPVNYAYAPGDVRRYGAKIDGSTDDTAAFVASIAQAAKAGGSDPFWPAGAAVVSQIVVQNSMHIRTEGYATVLQQKSGQPAATPVILFESNYVDIEPLTIIGNISTDSGEHMHGIQIGGTAANSLIRIHGLLAQNIRGDALYMGGTPTFPLKNVHVGAVSGTNIYRNVIGFVGVSDAHVQSITGSQIGYRLFDVEPNAGSNESPTGIHIGYVRGSNINFAGDPSIPIGSVIIDYCELDNSLHADSSPGYPTHPSAAGNIAVILANTQSLTFGTLKVRGYQERVINDTGSTVKCRLVINYFDCDTSNTTETTFKTLIEGSTLSSVTINGGVIVLQGADRYIAKDVRVTIRECAISGGALVASSSNSRLENLQVNASSLASNLLASVNNSVLVNVAFTNDASATLMLSCQDNVLINCSGAPSNFVNSGTNHKLLKSTFNSIFYDDSWLPSGVFSTGQSGSSPVLATNGTISTSGLGVTRVSPGGAVTGVILQAGTVAGQACTVINESVAANSITFAAAGTSNVADGTSAVLVGLRSMAFTWDTATSRWYRS